jgi:hypothetical protein
MFLLLYKSKEKKMRDAGRTSDKGKSQVTSEQEPLDLARITAKQQEKLELDSTRRFLPGGMDDKNRGESSKQDETDKHVSSFQAILAREQQRRAEEEALKRRQEADQKAANEALQERRKDWWMFKKEDFN